MTPIQNRAELVSVLAQAANGLAFLNIKDVYGKEYSGTIQFIENGLLDKIIIESHDLVQYSKVSLADITRIDSDILLELNNIVSQNFEVVTLVGVSK
ncbi:MAG TPA: hypothetical protein VGK59_07705 [Ohtaekwangia sp.]